MQPALWSHHSGLGLQCKSIVNQLLKAVYLHSCIINLWHVSALNISADFSDECKSYHSGGKSAHRHLKLVSRDKLWLLFRIFNYSCHNFFLHFSSAFYYFFVCNRETLQYLYSELCFPLLLLWHIQLDINCINMQLDEIINVKHEPFLSSVSISTSVSFDGLLVTGLYTSTPVQSAPIPASAAFPFGKSSWDAAVCKSNRMLLYRRVRGTLTYVHLAVVTAEIFHRLWMP